MARYRNPKPIIEAPQSRRSPDITERLIIDSRAPSPYHDLWKLEPEEDLIQLDSSHQFRSQNLTSSGTKPHKHTPKEDIDTSDECRRESVPPVIPIRSADRSHTQLDFQKAISHTVFSIWMITLPTASVKNQMSSWPEDFTQNGMGEVSSICQT